MLFAQFAQQAFLFALGLDQFGAGLLQPAILFLDALGGDIEFGLDARDLAAGVGELLHLS